MWIVCSTNVAKLMATSAGHVVAPFILLNPELASWALLSLYCIDPLEESSLIGCFLHFPLFFCLCSDLVLFTSLALMVDGLASEAVWHLAARAVVAHDLVFLAKAVIVTVVGRAFEVVTRLSIPDHLPLMSSPTDQFRDLKKRFEVSLARDWSLALYIRTQDGKSTLFNLCSHVLSQALFVIYICAGAKAVQLFGWVFKHRLIAYLARIVSLFAFFIRVVLPVNLLHCLQFNSFLAELYLSSLVSLFVPLFSFFANPLS